LNAGNTLIEKIPETLTKLTYLNIRNVSIEKLPDTLVKLRRITINYDDELSKNSCEYLKEEFEGIEITQCI